jgi:hypothetical protein
MNTTRTPLTTATGALLKPGGRRRWRYVLTGLVVFAATVAFFYTEENWRGRRAWENCKRELEAKGVILDWAYWVPAPVPDNQNIFGVPEMQKWFTGRGRTDLSEKLTFAGEDSSTNAARLVVANVTISRPGATPATTSTVLNWSDGTNTQAEVTRMITGALGPTGFDPSGFSIMAKKHEEFRPVQIFLQCQTAPTLKELEQFLPKHFVRNWENLGATEDVRVEPTGGNSYQVTMRAPISAADLVAWSDTIKPEMALVRQAVQRPYARMAGDYSFPPDMPIPNFVTMRGIAQRLAALAECHMLLGQPEKALDDLTFLHQVCRLLEARPTGRPMSLVAAMINVAITGLYVSTIQDGIRMQVWREPQLAALQEQLKDINLRPFVVDALAFEQVSVCTIGEKLSAAEMEKRFGVTDPAIEHTKTAFFSWAFNRLFSRVTLYRLIPRGWVYQNMVVCANLHQIINDNVASANELIDPRKIAAINPTIERELAHPSPFKILAKIAIPNVSKALQTMTLNQTKVNQAQVACALERYRLARGEYPSTLEELVPQFIDKIPHDLIGGQPPHYRRTDDGKFLLYSIGWTEKDHGGQAGKDGDWVWGED